MKLRQQMVVANVAGTVKGGNSRFITLPNAGCDIGQWADMKMEILTPAYYL